MNFHQSSIKHVNRIELNVADIDRQTDFYHNILGLQVLKAAPTQTTLIIGEEDEIVLNKIENGRFAQMTEAGLFHIAILLDDVTDLGALIKHLSQHNIAISGGDHLVSEAIYFSDPEGNGIELYIDRPADLWHWENEHVNMDTLPLDVSRILEDSGNKEWTDMPKNAKIGHLHLKAYDLKASSQFYIQIGFQITSVLPQALFLSEQKYHHHIAINTWQSNQPLRNPERTYGLTAFNIIDENKKSEVYTTPEGLKLTINQEME